jgi:hypothetical protein
VGCGNINRHDPPTRAATQALLIVGIQNARFWPDTETESPLREIAQLNQRQAAISVPGQR